jgi:hypothetical protein
VGLLRNNGALVITLSIAKYKRTQVLSLSVLLCHLSRHPRGSPSAASLAVAAPSSSY